MNETGYGAEAITVLEGLEAVRTRPGMYIGSTGPTGLHHLVWEVVDNAVDEAMAGHCDTITVTVLPDGACQVTDNGRGIPVDRHPQYKNKTAAEVVLTVLHAGGKFGGGGYKMSGGLHGVGVSVVNALSSRLELDVWRDGKHHHQSYASVSTAKKTKPGSPQGPLKVIGKVPKSRTGTRVTFWPDRDVFETVEFSARTICERLQTMAFLNRGLTLVFEDQRDGQHQQRQFRADGGIVDYVHTLTASKGPLFSKVGHFADTSEEGEIEVAWMWTGGYHEALHSFANGISTTEGGQHAEGFRKALTQAVNRYARQKGLLKDRDQNLQGDDVREGMTAIISVRLGDPQFEGQTKSKLGNPSIRTLAERSTNQLFGRWLEEHPNEAKAIVEKASVAAKSRVAAKKAKELTRRKTALDSGGLPGKLTDCNLRKGGELLIVEGNSAAGTVKTARDPRTQAVLPLKGKVLNVERASMDKVLKNAEIQSLVGAIGAGLGRDCDLSKARYDRVTILADADVDGGHILTLLLTIFHRLMRPLVDDGRVHIALPPLFAVTMGTDKHYLHDERALRAFEAEHPNRKMIVTRLKGLGEMDAHELKETVLAPETRRLARVTIEQAAQADETLSLLMGDNAAARRDWIEANATDVSFVDI